MSRGILNHCETGPFSEDAYDQSLLVRTLVVHQSCFPADGAGDRGVWVDEAHLSPILISSSLSGVSCKRLYLAGLSCRFSFHRVFPSEPSEGRWTRFQLDFSPSVVGLVFLMFCLSSGGAPFVALNCCSTLKCALILPSHLCLHLGLKLLPNTSLSNCLDSLTES